jgi:hypothetical protein
MLQPQLNAINSDHRVPEDETKWLEETPIASV